MAEETLRQSMIISNGSFGVFLERGLSLALLGLIAALVVLPFVAAWLRRRRRPAAPPSGPSSTPPRERIGV